MSEQEYDEGKSAWSTRRMIAAGFLAVLVVAAAALFIVNRNGGDDSSSAGSGSSTQQGGQSLADEYEWRHKEADFFGQMVYAAEDSLGQILSETTREYESPTSTEARESRAEGVVFQATDFSGRLPIPFSTTDGPTGFDGMVPVGYSQSAAGASLAAAAYITQMYNPPSYAEYIEKATTDPTTEELSEARKRVADNEQYFDAGDDIVGFANTAYDVVTFDGDYARVNLFVRDNHDEVGQVTMDLRWVDGMWKGDETSELSVLDAMPQGVSIWR
ncbi:hypothetical protein ACT3SZ_14865 [Corynebacterium sp. AOP40-9SA-29]|uniref:hypothetical protein n=1 Tax=Corynebacterium sp. AOP40-9SA-29 TaxID=3457677 RepID=UPI0040334DB2